MELSIKKVNLNDVETLEQTVTPGSLGIICGGNCGGIACGIGCSGF